MQFLNGGYSPPYFPVSNPNDSYLNDWAADQALMEASRRLSRGYNGQRAGMTMRVTKPSSANNSPGTCSMSSRRRTLFSDGQGFRRSQQTQEHLSLPHSSANRAARPVSWHPSSHIYAPQPFNINQQQTPYQHFAPSICSEQQELSGAYPSISPLMASYSNNTSPCSAFSPLPITSYQSSAPQYLAHGTWDLPQTSQYPSLEGFQQYAEGLPSLTPSLDTPGVNTLDWTSYTHGMNSTTPPTPDSFVGLQQSQPAVPEEDAVPYETLDEPEEEGEILVAMGLYDTPEKFEEDPQLNNYRSTISSLLGATYQRQEPTGKGLKLEETWVPPKSEDSDEEEEEDDDEEAEEEATEQVPQKTHI